MKRTLPVVIVISVVGLMFLSYNAESDPIIHIQNHFRTIPPPSVFMGDTSQFWGDSATTAYMKRCYWYPYPDTVRYYYLEEYTFAGMGWGPAVYYANDTINLNITVRPNKDSVYFDVGNSLPDSIYFRIFKYSNFKLNYSIGVSTENLTFIYRGREFYAGYVPGSLDSSNFYLKKNSFNRAIEIFFDIVGLDTGIYEVLPTFTIFPEDSQEYVYKIQSILGYPFNDTIYSRLSEPLHVRKKLGAIDSVNVYLSNAFRMGIALSFDSAMYYIDLAERLNPGSAFTIQCKEWVYNWCFLPDLGKQMHGCFDLYRREQTDQYLRRLIELNVGSRKDFERIIYDR